jgi:hypothetical protein
MLMKHRGKVSPGSVTVYEHRRQVLQGSAEKRYM